MCQVMQVGILLTAQSDLLRQGARQHKGCRHCMSLDRHRQQQHRWHMHPCKHPDIIHAPFRSCMRPKAPEHSGKK